MRKREYLGQLELMVLLAVIRPSKDAYGVQICHEIAEKSGREGALASVFAGLRRLETKGYVMSALGEPTAERGGRARTYFKATAAGLREARERTPRCHAWPMAWRWAASLMRNPKPPALALWLLKY